MSFARFGPSVSRALGKLIRSVVSKEVGFEWIDDLNMRDAA
jgi:hypothetical protein